MVKKIFPVGKGERALEELNGILTLLSQFSAPRLQKGNTKGGKITGVGGAARSLPSCTTSGILIAKMVMAKELLKK